MSKNPYIILELITNEQQNIKKNLYLQIYFKEFQTLKISVLFFYGLAIALSCYIKVFA